MIFHLEEGRCRHLRSPWVNIPAKGSFSDSHGSSNHPIKSNRAGYVINISQVPMVYEGEAVFNFTTERQEDE